MPKIETKKCKVCHSDIPKKAKKCSKCITDQRSWVAKNPIKAILIGLIGLLILIAISTNNSQESKEKVVSTFNEQSRQRFDKIKESFPELDSIGCYNDDCTNVVYFNLSSIPDDLEFIIRSNTATFSNFKLKNTGTSHVTIFATYNSKTIFQCDGLKGIVDKCK